MAEVRGEGISLVVHSPLSLDVSYSGTALKGHLPTAAPSSNAGYAPSQTCEHLAIPHSGHRFSSSNCTCCT